MRKDGPTEATFQPEELKRHLCESRENEMKQAIRKQLRSMGAKTAGQITLTTRSPTRYEKILDDYFRTRAKAQLPRKISLEQIPNYKVRYSTEEQKKQTAPLSCKKQGKEN